MPPKTICWNKEATTEVLHQFNLHTSMEGEEGWDPENRAAEYIKPRAQQNDVLRVYLEGNLGGRTTNKDSSKLLHGYERVASEYFVSLAKAGIRRSTYLVLADCCLLCCYLLH
jgi:hypothetical protein